MLLSPLVGVTVSCLLLLDVSGTTSGMVVLDVLGDAVGGLEDKS